MTEFNGEIKAYRDAAVALRDFTKAHAQLLSQLESLQGAVEGASEQVKAKAKRILVESGEGSLERVSQGVKVWARKLFTDKFDLSPAAVRVEDLCRLHNAKTLTIDAKAYKAARENGEIDPKLDEIIRTESLKQTNSGVELVVE